MLRERLSANGEKLAVSTKASSCARDFEEVTAPNHIDKLSNVD